jgi:poly(glycerol-phosphate) alpha-glucosyltransferase
MYEVRNLGPLPTSRKLLQSKHARLVHTHGLWTGLSASAMQWRRKTGGKTIVSPHGMLDRWALKQGNVKKQIALKLVELAHMNGSAAVHALNVAEAEAIRECGVTAPIAIIPNGVDPAPERSFLAPNWMDRPTLLFLGRLHPKKGISELIDAWAEAYLSLPNWQLAIAGWDDGPNEFRKKAAASGAPIIFPGPLFDDEKLSALDNCAAFVLPSHSEGLPMAVLEAWAHKKAVFMTQACNLPEGFTCSAAIRITTDPREIAETLKETLDDAPRLAKAGRAGHRLVEQTYSWDIIAQRFRDLYAFAFEDTQSCGDLWYFES